MTISDENQKTLQQIARTEGPIQKQEIAECLKIWIETDTFFTPQFITDLFELLKNWDDATAEKTIEAIIAQRIERDSRATNNPKADSTRIMIALIQRLELPSTSYVNEPYNPKAIQNSNEHEKIRYYSRLWTGHDKFSGPLLGGVQKSANDLCRITPPKLQSR